VLDLYPGNSAVAFLLREGFDVFLLDWGVADEADVANTLESYADSGIPDLESSSTVSQWTVMKSRSALKLPLNRFALADHDPDQGSRLRHECRLVSGGVGAAEELRHVGLADLESKPMISAPSTCTSPTRASTMCNSAPPGSRS